MSFCPSELITFRLTSNGRARVHRGSSAAWRCLWTGLFVCFTCRLPSEPTGPVPAVCICYHWYRTYRNHWGHSLHLRCFAGRERPCESVILSLRLSVCSCVVWFASVVHYSEWMWGSNRAHARARTLPNTYPPPPHPPHPPRRPATHTYTQKNMHIRTHTRAQAHAAPLPPPTPPHSRT